MGLMSRALATANTSGTGSLLKRATQLRLRSSERPVVAEVARDRGAAGSTTPSRPSDDQKKKPSMTFSPRFACNPNRRFGRSFTRFRTSLRA